MKEGTHGGPKASWTFACLTETVFTHIDLEWPTVSVHQPAQDAGQHVHQHLHPLHPHPPESGFHHPGTSANRGESKQESVLPPPGQLDMELPTQLQVLLPTLWYFRGPWGLFSLLASGKDLVVSYFYYDIRMMRP